jgi:hypothetical protein
MDASMLGIGVGFDTLGANTIHIHEPNKSKYENIIIEDSREGWVTSIRILLGSFFQPKEYPYTPVFNYDHIRPAGEPIKGFGGISQGPQILLGYIIYIYIYIYIYI